jgi:hypothetical protein
MAHEEAARQFSFRLPEPLVARVESCTQKIRNTGLDVTRADVVRLLLKHALDATNCDINVLLSTKPARRRSR